MPIMNANDPDSDSDEENSPEMRQLLAIQTKRLPGHNGSESWKQRKNSFMPRAGHCRTVRALRRCVANGIETLASLPGVVRKGGCVVRGWQSDRGATSITLLATLASDIIPSSRTSRTDRR